LILILLWTAAILTLSFGRFAVYSPLAELGEEAATALAALLGALVIALFPRSSDPRLRWVSMALGLLGLGALLFGYLLPLTGREGSLNGTMYEALIVRAVVGALLVVGLVPARPPVLTRAVAAFAGTLVVLAVGSVVVLAPHLPPLITIPSLQGAARSESAVLRELTVWHWLLASLTLLLTLSALVGAIRHRWRLGLDSWFVVALVYLAGSQMQNLFWPSTYTGVLTTANLLRLTFALLIAAGAVVELKRIADERSTLLAVAEEHGRQMADLAQLKSSFTAMVAHELTSPLAAIRTTAAVLSTGALAPPEQMEMLRAIDQQVEMLTGLTEDMHAASSMERAEFRVEVAPVSAAVLVAEAASYARTLDGDHRLIVSGQPEETVLADPQRIAQVLRNLLSNAAKYSDPGMPIELRSSREANRVRFTVCDRGYGIHPDDMTRIFEKFGRGRDRSGRSVAGVGLGLYLSRRIAQLHGSELAVTSTLDEGSSFSFDLEVVE
jgi:signal transduction histidine kinase